MKMYVDCFLKMEKVCKKDKNIGRKIFVGKVLMNTIRKYEDGISLAQLKILLQNKDEAVFISDNELLAAVENGLQRGSLVKEGISFKAAEYVDKLKNPEGIIKEYSFKEQKHTSKYKCLICLDEKRPKDCVRLWCTHVYCMPCIVNWENVSNTCPLCRQCLRYGEILY